MRRFLSLIAAAAVVVTPLIATPGAASAAPGRSASAVGDVIAIAEDVVITGSPTSQSGALIVKVRNTGTTPQAGHFVVSMPQEATLDAASLCTVDSDSSWFCGGATIAPGATRTYALKVKSKRTYFSIVDEAWVGGRDAKHQGDQSYPFNITWPDKVTASADDVVFDGNKKGASGPLIVKVTNNGTVTEKGYFLVRVAQTATLAATPTCTLDGDNTWFCGGASIPAGASHTYTLKVVARSDVPGGTDDAEVAGRTADRKGLGHSDFLLVWPEAKR